MNINEPYWYVEPPTSCAKIESKHLASSKRPNAKCCDETGLANSQKGPILCRDSKWWHTPLQLLLCRMHDMTSKILTFGALHQIEHCLPWPRRTINHRSHCFDDMHRHLVLLSQSQSCRGCGHPCQGLRWFFHWKLDIIYILQICMYKFLGEYRHCRASWLIGSFQSIQYSDGADGQSSIGHLSDL